jgi:carboxyl-terminal processing protease
MKFRGSLYFSILVLAIVAGAWWPSSSQTNPDKEALLMNAILSGLNQLHFQPVAVDDQLSEKVFDLYIDRMDGGKLYFTQKDIHALEQFRLSVDDEIRVGSYEFFNLSTSLMDAAIEKTESYYKEILAAPFDFETMEIIELDGEQKDWAADDEELREYWRKYLKYEVLRKLHRSLDKQQKASEEKAKGAETKDNPEEENGEENEEEDDDDDILTKTFEELEQKAREDVLEDFEARTKRMDKLRREDWMTSYLNALTNIYDPHTGYLKPKDKEDFDINMSGTLEGIGARLSQKDDYVQIVEVIPGGPAWKQKELEANDLILEVAQADGEPVSVVGMRVDDAVKLIRGKKGTEVRLTVKKSDGTTEIIPIIRDVVIIDEGYVKSVILDYGDDISKIGYIKLPSFYADFNRLGGRSSADDMAAELDKLNEAGVGGIILDLRSNGGGSLNDAIEMTGLFIEEGPVVQVKARQGGARIYRDKDPRVQYDGPLIVLVNQFSASASEILAGALQDYGRAVLVGSTSTFGKGTVQRFFDLDQALRGHDDVKPLGQVKLTIQKFYRIDGGSNQLKGVIPDIVLPDKYMYMTVGEKDNDYPLDWSQIEPVEFSQSVYSLDFLDELKKRSQQRTAESPVFGRVAENAQRLKDQSDVSEWPLQLDAYTSLQQERKEEADKYKNLFPVIDLLSVSNLEADKEYIAIDESRQARNDDWIESIRKDPYIEEALLIMNDMMNLD